jgi:folate-binding protein YgfZ
MSLTGSSLHISPTVVSVKGDEARKFLQALLSGDISRVKEKESVYSLLLSPAGKTLFAMLVYCINDDEFLLVSERDESKSLVLTLCKYLIRTKAQIDDVSKHYQAIISYSKAAQDTLRVSDHKIAANIFGDHRLNVILRKRMLDGEIDDNDIYNALRISRGAVSVKKDLGDSSIAQEAGLDRSAISFNKGCFLGQELVCRIDSRSASTPNAYYAVATSSPVLEGSEVYCDEESYGSVTSTIPYRIDRGGFEEFFGEYSAIVKISRKGSMIVEESAFTNLFIDKTISVVKIEKVKGYFRI